MSKKIKETIKQCKHCGHKFVINQLKRGPEPIYCRSACRLREYRKKHGTTSLKEIIGGDLEAEKANNLNGTNVVSSLGDILKRIENLENILKEISNKNLPKIVEKLPKEKSKSNKIKGFVGDVAVSTIGNIIGEFVTEYLKEKDDKPLTVGNFKEYILHYNKAITFIAENIVETNARLKNRFPTQKELEAERKTFNRFW